MTKAEIVELIAKGTGLTRKETAAVVDGFLSAITYALQQNEKVELRGFGTFCLRKRKQKITLNPKTGKLMQIPERIVPDFKPSLQLKRKVVQGLKEREALEEKPSVQTDLFSEWDHYIIEEDENINST